MEHTMNVWKLATISFWNRSTYFYFEILASKSFLAVFSFSCDRSGDAVGTKNFALGSVATVCKEWALKFYKK